MLKFNFKYELKQLLRSRWIQLLSVLLFLLFGFSAFNGKQKIEKRKNDVNKVRTEVSNNDQTMLKLLDSVEQGLEVSVPYWTVPNSPMAVGNYYPRAAAMEPQPMSFISTGQSDLFTHYVKPTATGDDFALNFTEMTSPVQLLFGSFDLAFVIIYLLPLLIIAFTYNVLSAEKESGTYRLLAAQPINIRKWVLQKLGLRFFWLSVIVILTLVLTFLLFGLNILGEPSFFMLLGLTLAYMLFWFSIAFLVNLWVDSSAKNAVALLALWVMFVLLIPSMLNQLGTTFYPMQSRTLMINEMRQVKADVTKKQDEILDDFLRDHPEYAINDTTQNRSFYHRYMASQKLIKQELEPLVNSYEEQLQKQQQWVGRFKWLSPAVTVQESLNGMAGTSTEDYEDFRVQVIGFANIWRDHLIPFLYNNQSFSSSDVAELPAFIFQPLKKKSLLEIPALLVFSILIFGVGLWSQKNSKFKSS